MSSRILGADDLGEKGQSRFREICADASITCNPSTRDRTGWDFLVELPFETALRVLPLDKRPLPISSHIQVKTVWDTTETVKLRLSSVERLAKEPKPSFIYVFRVNERLEFKESIIIHLLGDNLAKVLKRLRHEENDSSRAINRKTISFSLKEAGAKLAPTGEAFTTVVRQTCEFGLTKYIELKTQQLERLGYDRSRYNGTFTFHSENLEALVDVSLGLREIEASGFKMLEKRFGIELPILDERSGTVRMQPQALTVCKIVASGPISCKSAKFEGELFAPAIPNLPTQYRKLYIRGSDFEACFTKAEGDSTKIKLSILTNRDQKRTLAEWTNILRFFRLASGGQCKIVITPEQNKFKPFSFAIPERSLITPRSPEFYDHLLSRLQAASNLLSHTGATDRALKWEDFAQSLDEIAALDELTNIQSTGPELNFTVTRTAEIPVLPEEVDLLTVSFLAFAGTFFAYSGIAHMKRESQENDEVRYTSTRFTGLRITELPRFPAGYEEFKRDSKEANPSQWQLVIEPSAPLEEQPP